MIKDKNGCYNPDAVVAITANADGTARVQFGGQSYLDLAASYDDVTKTIKAPAPKSAKTDDDNGDET